MDIETLHRIRLHEVKRALSILGCYKNSGTLIEIGAGTGFQSRVFSEHGYTVEAVDLKESTYSGNMVYPVKTYDGVNLPFEDDSFDILFSSNVLEHILKLDSFQREMGRVLKDDGLAIHILPTGSWRVWTTLLHPILEPFRLMRDYRRKLSSIVVKHPQKNEISTDDLTHPPRNSRLRFLKLFLIALIPRRHGERGNIWSEIYWFSKRQWYSFFEESGWTVESYDTSNIFYDGSLVPAAFLPMGISLRLSSVLGSSTHIFVLRPPRVRTRATLDLL